MRTHSLAKKLVWLLVVALMASMMSVAVFAEDNNGDPDPDPQSSSQVDPEDEEPTEEEPTEETTEDEITYEDLLALLGEKLDLDEDALIERLDAMIEIFGTYEEVEKAIAAIGSVMTLSAPVTPGGDKSTHKIETDYPRDIASAKVGGSNVYVEHNTVTLRTEDTDKVIINFIYLIEDWETLRAASPITGPIAGININTPGLSISVTGPATVEVDYSGVTFDYTSNGFNGYGVKDDEWSYPDFEIDLKNGYEQPVGNLAYTPVSLYANFGLRSTVSATDATLYLASDPTLRTLTSSSRVVDLYDDMYVIVLPAAGKIVDESAELILNATDSANNVVLKNPVPVSTLTDAYFTNAANNSTYQMLSSRGAYAFEIDSTMDFVSTNYAMTISNGSVTANQPYTFTSDDAEIYQTSKEVIVYYHGAFTSPATIDIELATGDVTGGFAIVGGSASGVTLDPTTPATGNFEIAAAGYTAPFEITYTDGATKATTYKFTVVPAVSVERADSNTTAKVTAEDNYRNATISANGSAYGTNVEVTVAPNRNSTVDTLTWSVEIGANTFSDADFDFDTPGGNIVTKAPVTVTATKDGDTIKLSFTGITAGDEIVVNANYTYKSPTVVYPRGNGGGSAGGGASRTTTTTTRLPVTPDNATVPQGTSFSWTIADASPAGVVSVSVDGSVVDPIYYTLTSGSCIVTLNGSYLDTLALGSHTLTVNFWNNSASTTFNVVAGTGTGSTGTGTGTTGNPNDNPGTGATPIGMGIAVLAASLVCAAVVAPKKSK